MKASVQLIYDTLIARYPALIHCFDDIAAAYELLVCTYKNGGKVMICGNGGSAADSDHIVGELMKGFILRRHVGINIEKQLTELFGEDGSYLAHNLQGALPAINLTSQSAIISAFANDVEPDMIFAQQVFGYGNENDVLICLSTSGNSKNIVNAAKIAKLKDTKVISMTGMGGGTLRELSDVLIDVPETQTYKIQEYHLPVYHALCAMIEDEFFGI